MVPVKLLIALAYLSQGQTNTISLLLALAPFLQSSVKISGRAESAVIDLTDLVTLPYSDALRISDIYWALKHKIIEPPAILWECALYALVWFYGWPVISSWFFFSAFVCNMISDVCC